MKTVTGPLLTVSDTAMFLAAQLGPGRQWVDFLNDCRQGRGSLEGHRLLPLNRAPGSPGMRKKPMYLPAIVSEFIRRIRASTGLEVPYPFRARYYTYEVVEGPEELAWRVTKAVPA
jgi:hypothetical protein